jgi:hypothetical protein
VFPDEAVRTEDKGAEGRAEVLQRLLLIVNVEYRAHFKPPATVATESGPEHPRCMQGKSRDCVMPWDGLQGKRDRTHFLPDHGLHERILGAT